MREASQRLKNLLQTDGPRHFFNKVEIWQRDFEHSTLVATLNPSDLRISGNTYTDELMDGSNFTVGTALGKTTTIIVDNSNVPTSIWSRANIFFTLSIGIFFPEVNPPYGEYEYIPIGDFDIISVNIGENTTSVSGADYMGWFDDEFGTRLATFTPEYPISADELLRYACEGCGVEDALTADQHSNLDNYTIWEEPKNTYTYRQIVGFIAQLICCNARINEIGQLEFVELSPYIPPDTPDPRGGYFDTLNYPAYDLRSTIKNYTLEDDFIRLTGVEVIYTYNTASGEDVTESVLVGNKKYAVVIENNPLIQTSTIADKVAKFCARHLYVAVGMSDMTILDPPLFKFSTFSASCTANPLIEPGDWVRVSDRLGNSRITMLTSVQFSVNGYTNISCTAESPESKKANRSSFSSRQVRTMRKDTNKQMREYYNKRITYDTQDIQVGDDLPTGNLYLVYEE